MSLPNAGCARVPDLGSTQSHPRGVRTGTRPGAHAAVTTLMTLAAVALAGCSQFEPAAVRPSTTDPADLYVRLTLNHTAVNLTNNPAEPAANTLQLVATPYDGTGAVLADAPAPVFNSLDTARVTVTPEGVLHGVRTGTAKVAAQLVYNGVRHTDTVVVQVHDFTPAPVLETFSLQVPPEQAVWYASTLHPFEPLLNYLGIIPPVMLSPRFVTTTGQELFGLAAEYESLDPAIAFVDRRSGAVTPIAPGYARVVARTTVFGISKTDRVTYTVQPPFLKTVFADANGFFISQRSIKLYAPTVKIVAGGWVEFIGVDALPADDVVFDDPTTVAAPPANFCDFLTDPNGGGLPPEPYCGEGNIPTFLDGAGIVPFRYRRFPVPGTYPFRNTRTGARGTIMAVEPTPPPPAP